MSLIWRNVGLGCLWSLFLCSQIQAQVVLTQDADWPYRPAASQASGLRATSPDTLPFSAGQPFFDDFSNAGTRPDSTKWFLSDIDFRFPLISQRGPVMPPSVGALQFDGVRNAGGPYSISLSSGLCDQLSSHYLDLRNFSPASNLRLTFFLQPQGKGDSPESTDSFRVFFRRPTDTLKVFSRAGSALTGFQQISIPLTDPGFFHGRFQMVFETIGSQNGLLDNWFLDYVLLAPNRTVADTSYQDLAFSNLKTSPLHPFTASPYWLVEDLAPFLDTEAALRNFRPQASTPQVTTRITDPVALTPFSGTTQHQLTASEPPSGFGTVLIPPFSAQSFTSTAAYRWQSIVSSTGDIHPENDTLRFDIPLNSQLAYDDGEADAGFGLNRDWGYGMEFNLNQNDSLAAVWICFVPTINLRLGAPVYMDNESFRIVCWKDPNPDSVITKYAGVKVNYGTAPNTFIRYQFPNPVQVPARFWVGIQQFNDLPLGVGFDKSFDNRSLVYYDSSGKWTNPALRGTLMIRPELVDPFLVSGIEKTTNTWGQVFPNPVSIGADFVNWNATTSAAGMTVNWTWSDIFGRKVAQGVANGWQTGQIPLPDQAAPGVYLLSIQQGSQSQTFKMLLRDLP